MKKLLKQLLGESAIYGISGMVSRFISIFLVPLYTKILLPADYGKLSLVNSTFYFVTVLSVFAMDSASARWYYDDKDEEKRKSVMATWFWFQLGMSALMALILILSSTVLSSWIMEDSQDYILFIIPALGLITSILPTMASNWLRYQRKPVHMVVFTIANVLINVGLNVWLVLYLSWGIKGILIASLLSNAMASLYVFFIMKDWIRLNYFSKTKWKEMFKYALPLVPTSFAFWILNSSSSFVLNYFHGKEEVGLFQLGSMVASAVAMIVGAFQMAWGPFAFSIIDKPNAKQVIAFVLTAYGVIMCSGALFVALFSREVLIIFTNEHYYDAYLTAGILAFNGIIYGYAYIAVLGCNMVKDNKPLAYSVLLASIVTALGYILLVPVYGKIGAALSMVIGYLVVPVYLFYKSQQVWPFPFKFGIALIIFGLAVSCYLIYLLTFQEQSEINVHTLWKLVYFFLYLLVLAGLLIVTYKNKFKEIASLS